MLESRKGMPLHTKIFIGLILGAIAGFTAQYQLGKDSEQLKWVTDNVTGPVGSIFLNLIFMVVVPLLFSALVVGVAEIGEARKIGSVGLKSLLMTVVLSGIAVLLGLGMVNAFRPGDGIGAEQRDRLLATYAKSNEKKAEENKAKAEAAPTVADQIIGLVTKNPLKAAVDALDGAILQFMIFALIFGIALACIEQEKALPVISFLDGLFAVSIKIIEFAMKLAPIAVFALIFNTAATLGLDAFAALAKYAVLVLIALAIHLFVVYSLAIRFVAKRNPLDFFRSIRTVMITAFATSSSNATLPTAIKVSEENLGLPPNINRFVLTIGATANQNGTALFEGITVLFLAQLFGIHLDIGQQLVVMGLAIVAGIGTAGVPGGSWPFIALILIRVGVPAEAIALCLGIDRILDMSRTVLNVTGDITIAACVATMEGQREVVPESASG